ncbi:MAG TPA: hypothetical protein VFN55_10920 [Solirubrobacteraceae bacterium]|nr:hypothetical protein [Solirubrobacteraceae bacterium]
MSGSDYPRTLRAELGAAGIIGLRRERIVAEIEDHLACDPGADLGDPRLLARQFADELGTLLARRAAVRSFTGLAVAGLLFAAAFIGSPAAAFGAAPANAPLLGQLARIVAVLAPQFAFAAGLLAMLRAVSGRHARVIGAPAARMIVRRAIVATGSGLAAMISLGVIALAFSGHVSSGWQTLALIASGGGALAIAAALPALRAAIRLRPVADGPQGDLFDDLGPFVPAVLRGHPWRLAVLVAGGVAVAIALAGVPGHDLYDGIARGIADGALCLLAFATLGRYLGLWSPGDAPAGGEPAGRRSGLMPR